MASTLSCTTDSSTLLLPAVLSSCVAPKPRPGGYNFTKPQVHHLVSIDENKQVKRSPGCHFQKGVGLVLVEMLVLFETPAGYALFKAKDGKLKDEDMSALFKTPELASGIVRAHAHFYARCCRLYLVLNI